MSEHGSDDESLAVILLAVLGVAVAGPAFFWDKVVTWLVAHRVLASSAADPVVVLPAAGGAGLDGRRMVIVVAVVLLAVGAGYALRARTREQS